MEPFSQPSPHLTLVYVKLTIIIVTTTIITTVTTTITNRTINSSVPRLSLKMSPGMLWPALSFLREAEEVGWMEGRGEEEDEQRQGGGEGKGEKLQGL